MTRPTIRLAGWTLAALALICAGLEAVALWQVLSAHPAPPRWDMAGHGWLGMELWGDLRAGRPLDFLLDCNAQDKWPFGYSLLLVPFLALGGGSFDSARLLSLAGWVAVAPLSVLAARRVEPGVAGLLAGALAAVLWLATPVERVLGLVILRETVALALQLVALILYLRARQSERERSERKGPGECLAVWRAAGLATLALVLVKYTYALIWIAAVAADELLRMAPAERRGLGRRLADALTPWGPKPLGRRVLAVAADLVLVAAVVGINPGIGIWLVLAVTAGVAVTRLWRGTFAPRAWLRGLAPRHRAAVETVALPVAVWWLSPRPIHPKTVYSFFRNAGGGSERAPLDVLFYLRSYLADYMPHPAWGFTLLALACAAGIFAFRRKGPLGFLGLLTLLGLVLITLHPHKEVRYAATALPLVTLLGALGLGRLLFGSRPGAVRLAVGALVGVLAVGAAAVPAFRTSPRLARELSLYTGDPRLLPILPALAERVGPGGRVGMVGAVDELSADLVRWVLAREHGAAAPELDDYRKRFEPGAPRASWWPRVERWLEEERLDRVLVVRLAADSPWARRSDYVRHNAWQEEVAEALAETRMQEEPALVVPELGLTVSVLRVASSASSAVRGARGASQTPRGDPKTRNAFRGSGQTGPPDPPGAKKTNMEICLLHY